MKPVTVKKFEMRSEAVNFVAKKNRESRKFKYGIEPYYRQYKVIRSPK